MNTQHTSNNNTSSNAKSPNDGGRAAMTEVPMNEMVIRVLTTAKAVDCAKAKGDLGQTQAVEMAQGLVGMLEQKD